MRGAARVVVGARVRAAVPAAAAAAVAAQQTVDGSKRHYFVQQTAHYFADICTFIHLLRDAQLLCLLLRLLLCQLLLSHLLLSVSCAVK